MKRQREEGCCYAYNKCDSSWSLARSEYQRLLADWMAGKAFFTGVAFYGSAITLKLGDIVAVADVEPEHMALRVADTAADEAEDAIGK